MSVHRPVSTTDFRGRPAARHRVAANPGGRQIPGRQPAAPADRRARRTTANGAEPQRIRPRASRRPTVGPPDDKPPAESGALSRRIDAPKVSRVHPAAASRSPIRSGVGGASRRRQRSWRRPARARRVERDRRPGDIEPMVEKCAGEDRSGRRVFRRAARHRPGHNGFAVREQTLKPVGERGHGRRRGPREKTVAILYTTTLATRCNGTKVLEAPPGLGSEACDATPLLF